MVNVMKDVAVPVFIFGKKRGLNEYQTNHKNLCKKVAIINFFHYLFKM